MGDRTLTQDAALGSDSRPRAIRIASFVVQAAAFFAYLAAAPEEGTLLVAILCLIVGQMACAFVHECGHALAALACRWRIILFAVRPFGIQLPNRNIALIPKGFNDGAGGWVAVVPGSPDSDTKRRWAIILAAGPIASFLLAAFALLVWPGLAPTGRHASAFGTIGFGLGLALQALYGGLFSLLPGHKPGSSDGDQLRRLVREEDEAEMGPLAWLETLLRSNVRLRAIPEWIIAGIAAAGGGSDAMNRYFDTIEIGRTLDRAPPDAARARSLIDAYRARYGPDGWLAACDAWLAAIWEADPDRAKAALAAPGAAPGVAELTFAAEAAVAARTGEAAIARGKLKDMDEALKRASPFRNPTFDDIRRQIEALLP